MPIVRVHAKSLHLCPTLCGSLQPYGSSPPDDSVEDSPGKSTGCPPHSGDLPEQGIKAIVSMSPVLADELGIPLYLLTSFYSTITPLVIINLTRGCQNKNVILDIFLNPSTRSFQKRDSTNYLLCWE